MMNLYPYNTGHIMLVPNEHANDPEQLPREALQEIGETLPLLTTILRRVFGCDGFNVGLNIGSVAGAGVAAHLHQHIVPRWLGDANFMPIMASTMVIPETIPVTYAKIRAEFDRELTGATSARFVLFDAMSEKVLLHNRHLPSALLEEDVPVWRGMVAAVPEGVVDLELAGWAGSESTRAVPPDAICLSLRGKVDKDLSDGWELIPIYEESLDEQTSAQISLAHAQLAPVV
jgi:ATP adenylyltransferase